MRRPSAWTLRTRLVLVVTLVALVAILVVDAATFGSLRGSLVDRADHQVEQALTLAPPRPGSPGTAQDPQPTDGRRPQQRPAVTPAGTWLALVHPGAEAPAAEVVTGMEATQVEASDQPAFATVAPLLDELLDAPRTIDGVAGGPRFRIGAQRMGNGDIFVAAVPMSDIDTTLDRLLRIEWIVGGIAALGVILLALITVRAGLRPLDAIARAADDVAASEFDGELTRRVPNAGPATTEVGRLAAALNGMLERIDDSFAAQHATQRQLRQFIGDASHELRTPLTSIRGFAELARRKSAAMTDAQREHALARVEGEAEHLGRLVEDLLLLSRLDEGLPLHPETVDVAAIVATAVDAARVIEPNRSIHFESAGSIDVRADRVRVRQLIDNLLANVRAHAGDDADVEVRVTAAGGGFDLDVHDTGIGLDDEQLAAATDRFWRADTARARATGGSGLGLAIVAAIAEAHGGSVHLAAAPGGRGLAVTVHLEPLV